MVICLERGADLHMAQLMPLPLTVSCFSDIQTGFTFLVPANPGSPGQRVAKRACVCVCVCSAAVEIAVDLMWQEDMSHALCRVMSWHACHLRLSEILSASQTASETPTATATADEEEVMWCHAGISD